MSDSGNPYIKVNVCVAAFMSEACDSGMHHYVIKKFLVLPQLWAEVEDRNQEDVGCCPSFSIGVLMTDDRKR